MSHTFNADIHADLPAAASPGGFNDRKELGAFAFQRTRMPMVVADARQPDYPIVLANTSFLELTGYSADDLVGRNCRMLQGEATSPLAIAQIRLALAEQRDMSIEILNYKKDGEAFWNQLHISHIRDDDGNVAYIFASQIDVTELRKIQTLEATEHRLLMEVDHRAKNVLAVVDSVVRLSKSDDPAKYAAAVQHRVQALAAAHGLLSERGWNDVSLRDVVSTQITRYLTADIDMDGPDISIAAVVVQPLALVFHELISNAAVHGALSKPNGRLSLSWQKTGDVGGFVLTWNEIGVPRPAAEPKAGFGHVMIKAVVEKQLAGKISRQWDDHGLRIAIEVSKPPTAALSISSVSD